MKPNFEVKGYARMTSSMKKSKCNTAINAAAQKNGNLKALSMGHAAREIVGFNLNTNIRISIVL